MGRATESVDIDAVVVLPALVEAVECDASEAADPIEVLLWGSQEGGRRGRGGGCTDGRRDGRRDGSEGGALFF